jgi:transcription-repair coupling factor (superfamily II helicase)
MSNSIRDLLSNHIQSVFSAVKGAEEGIISNLSIPHTAILLSHFQSPFIFIEDKYEAAQRLHQDLVTFNGLFGHKGQRVLLLPPPLNIELVGQRIEALRGYLNDPLASLITSPDGFESAVDIFSLKEESLHLSVEQEIDRDVLKQWFIDKGYREVSMVIDKGEFSHRGYIFDVFPVTANDPVRLEFFGDTIDTIKGFDIETQRSISDLTECQIVAAKQRVVYEDMLQQMVAIKGAEIIISAPATVEGLTGGSLKVYHNPVNIGGIATEEASFEGLGILPQERKGLVDIAHFVENSQKPILTVLQSRAQAERFMELLEEAGVSATILPAEEALSYTGKVCITTGFLSAGLNLPSVMVLTDREVFGVRPTVKPSRRQRLSRILLNLEELKPGEWVVHRDHGIGRFKGIHRQQMGGYEQDLIGIEYGNGSLYIPVENIRLIQKYSTSDSAVPVIDKLGSKNWQKNKLRAKIGAEEIARRLITLYAERTVNRGFVFSDDTARHREFDEFFVYQETPDQLRAVEDIKMAMQSERPMDMLLCGDVGYGKTEVVMRAAFRAVYDKKQVAVLVPTTILAEQHYRTFKARFAGFPVRIETLNRFRSPSERARTLKAIARHEVDIIIGTHTLLRKDIAFADLGLLVIDEEHKFGVQQKERLKELKKGVDVLTLTATPIPRTLQMSLSGIRELSIIETPPEDRVSVKTFIAVYNVNIVKEAIERELRRQGQVYYVYNRINQLEQKAMVIRDAVKGATVAIAHGGMPERELEKVMLDFINGKIDVLVSTAIIGSGLDIPSANTIIIDRADLFGLADLYQLRGRVGRSNVQAYAYLLIPEEERITEDAMKRLQAIQDLTYLGAGFRLALKDLEIRGAGNILGAEQSGHIYRVGFDLYMEMLEEAVAELKGETLKATLNPEIRLALSAFIPDNYISDVPMRISVYRRLSECTSIEELEDMADELRDRFGQIPTETLNLIAILRLKVLARRLFINKISEDKDGYTFYFQQTDPELYGIPEDYYRHIFEVLSHLLKGIKGFRFIKDGFYVPITVSPIKDGLKGVEGLLNQIHKGYLRRFQ